MTRRAARGGWEVCVGDGEVCTTVLCDRRARREDQAQSHP
jgi:hypothetical protein